MLETVHTAGREGGIGGKGRVPKNSFGKSQKQNKDSKTREFLYIG